MTSARLPAALLGACAALLLLVAVAFAVGRFPVSAGDLASLLWARLTGAEHGLDPTIETVVMKIRGPRVAAALLIGAALAAAGAAYQNMFRNPLVSPDILGVSAGAAVGAVLGIFLSLNVIMIQSLAFAFGLAAVGLVYVTANAVRGHDPLLVLVLRRGFAPGRVRRADEIPRRSLQPAAGDHVLAARQPRFRQPGGRLVDAPAHVARPGPDVAAALAHQSVVPG
jgi:iron complex transport system permease protein